MFGLWYNFREKRSNHYNLVDLIFSSYQSTELTVRSAPNAKRSQWVEISEKNIGKCNFWKLCDFCPLGHKESFRTDQKKIGKTHIMHEFIENYDSNICMFANCKNPVFYQLFSPRKWYSPMKPWVLRKFKTHLVFLLFHLAIFFICYVLLLQFVWKHLFQTQLVLVKVKTIAFYFSNDRNQSNAWLTFYISIFVYFKHTN